MQDQDLTISVELCGHEAVVTLAGEIDLAGCPKLSTALRDTPPTGKTVTLDMAGVTFIDSTGITVIVDAHRRLESELRYLRLANPHPNVVRILELTGLTSTIDVIRTT